MRKKVNETLAAGASYAYIVRALAADNDKLDPKDRITLDSVRNHTARHFPVQSVTRATYRDIVECRAKRHGLTPLAFFEVLMLKAFRRVVDDDVEVSVDTGLRAAERLRSFLDRRDHGDDIAKIRLQVNQILNAVKAVVPQQMWGDNVEKLDQPQQHPHALDAETEDVDDDGYDSTEFAEEDDEF